MAEGGIPEEHFLELKETTDRLAVIGEPAKEKYQVAALLASLPRTYDTVVSSLCTNDSATFSFIQESLLNEEMRRSRNELQSGGQPKSLGGAVLELLSPVYR